MNTEMISLRKAATDNAKASEVLQSALLTLTDSTKTMQEAQATTKRIEMCPNFGLPRMTTCKLSTPCARLPKWRSQLKGVYVTCINGIPVSSLDEIKTEICRIRTVDLKNVKNWFCNHLEAIHASSARYPASLSRLDECHW